jgi:hypothetical protein
MNSGTSCSKGSQLHMPASSPWYDGALAAAQDAGAVVMLLLGNAAVIMYEGTNCDTFSCKRKAAEEGLAAFHRLRSPWVVLSRRHPRGRTCRGRGLWDGQA